MGFPIGDIFSIIYLYLADWQICLQFENDLKATRKRSKETNPISKRGFDLLSILILNAIQLKGR